MTAHALSCGAAPTQFSHLDSAEKVAAYLSGPDFVINPNVPAWEGGVSLERYVSPYRSSDHYVAYYGLANFRTAVYLADGNACGNPQSLQQQMRRSGLNIFDVDEEGEDRFERGSDNSIGIVATDWSGGREGQRLDLTYQRSWRPFEGSRARAVIHVPVSVYRVEGSPASLFSDGVEIPNAARTNSSVAFQASINAGVEFPISNAWSLTPRASLGVAQGGRMRTYFGGRVIGDGRDIQFNQEAATVGVSSRYMLRAGRGHLVVGNMLNYFTTVKMGIVKQEYYAHVDAISTSNGISYQLPLKQRVAGRQASVRAGYLWTHDFCSDAYYDDLHEFSLNFGANMREANAKSGADLMRVGLIYSMSKSRFTSRADYSALSLSLGYRF